MDMSLRDRMIKSSSRPVGVPASARRRSTFTSPRTRIAVDTICRLRGVRASCIPGVSRKMNWAVPVVLIPMILFLVVWGLWELIATFSPTTRFMSVDFPVFGFPMMPIKPDLNKIDSPSDHSLTARRGRYDGCSRDF